MCVCVCERERERDRNTLQGDQIVMNVYLFACLDVSVFAYNMCVVYLRTYGYIGVSMLTYT